MVKTCIDTNNTDNTVYTDKTRGEREEQTEQRERRQVEKVVRMRWRQKRFSKKKQVVVYSTLSGVLMRRRGGLDDNIWQPNLIRPLMVYHQLWNALERTNLITTSSSALPVLYVPPLHIFIFYTCDITFTLHVCEPSYLSEGGGVGGGETDAKRENILAVVVAPKVDVLNDTSKDFSAVSSRYSTSIFRIFSAIKIDVKCH